jgi:EAL domain-containing protein (putative c-di-GMP-specific phosphodiesterase class I)/FixJ family two-component response regulator
MLFTYHRLRSIRAGIGGGQNVAENPNAKYRVLLVEDEAFIRAIVVRALSQLGFTQFVEAPNGREALVVLNAPDSKIDLLLCDLDMPDMDGIEFVRHLASLSETPALAFVSGMEPRALRAAEALARAYRLRVLGCVTKPVTPRELQRVLDQLSIEAPPKAADLDLCVTEDRLLQAIDGNELCLYYQPKLWIDPMRIDSVEAVVRWSHPDHGVVGPSEFVPLAESTSLIHRMTENLVVQAFRQQALWRTDGFDAHIGINLSPSMLSDVSLPDRYAGLAFDLGIDPASIVFEITETGIVKDEAIYLEIVTRLHLKGFTLSIDDFGTGLSSLQKLEALPFAELKIDRQFVHGASGNSAKRAILTASIALARSLEMKVVAEGVEREDDWDLLKELKCDVAQGFFVARPMAPEALLAWVRSRSPSERTRPLRDRPVSRRPSVPGTAK